MSKQINEAFFGEPYKMNVKAPNGTIQDFAFEQLGVTDLFEFQEALDLFIKANKLDQEKDKEKVRELNIKASKLCIPLVRKMVDLSYPGTKEEDVEKFINANFLWLKTALILTNTQTLDSQSNAEVSLKDFVETERGKLDDKPVSSSAAEPKA